MKKKLGVFLAASLLLLSACGSNAKTGNEQVVKMGADLELSGGAAAYGQAELEGIKLAVEEINKDGGIDGKKIDLISKDNKSDSAEATSIATSLTTKDKVSVLLGPATTGAVKAVAPAVTRAKVPLVTPSATDDSVTMNQGKVQDYIFRTCFQDSAQGIALASFANQTLNAQKAVIVGDSSTDYGKGLMKTFKQKFKGDIVDTVEFKAGDKDFQAILTKIKDKDFDVIYLPGYYNEAGLIIKQARGMGIKQPILGGDGFGSTELVDLASPENVTDIYYTGHFSTLSDSNQKTKDFIEAFKKKYKKEPNAFNALAYDSVYFVKQAMEEEKSTDPAKVKDGLSNIVDFEGVTGKFSVDKDHNPEKTLVVIQMDKGKEVDATEVNP